MTLHDDEVLGKAYDARLMRRLLHYLRPYWRDVAVAFVAILCGSAASLAQPYLIKIAIDRYIAPGQLAGLDRLGALYLGILVAAFASEYLQTWMMQFTGQRIIAKHYYRPAHHSYRNPAMPDVELFGLNLVAQDWDAAQKRFFADGGVFDRIYLPK